MFFLLPSLIYIGLVLFQCNACFSMISHTLPSISRKTLFPLSKHLSHSLCSISSLSLAILCSLHFLKCLIFDRYKEGDSVPFIAKESTVDFSHVIGDHARHVEEFQALLPKLQPASMCSNGMQKPLMAIQVTVFPKAGISIGVTFNHAAVDGRAFIHFMKSWAFAHGSKRDLCFLNKPLPVYNKDLIKDPLGLAAIFMKDNWDWEDLDNIPSDKLRVTFVIKLSQVELLKNWVTRKFMEENGSEATLRMSTFVVTCAYMWICLIKLKENGNHHLSSAGNSNCHFVFLADCRERLNLPATYFGNSLEPRFAAATKSELLEENGILVAAKAIGREIMELDKGTLRESEKWLSKADEIFKSGGHFITIAGSPKLGSYEIDFGWGRPRKTEVAHIGSFGSVSMAESREEEGGVEFGLALSQDEFDSFNAVFQPGLFMLQ